MEPKQKNLDGSLEEPTGAMSAAEVFEKEQQEMYEDFNKTNRQEEGKFEIELSLKIKPTKGRTHSIPICIGTFRGSLIPEALDLAMQQRKFRKILDAVLDLDTETKRHLKTVQ